MSLNKTKSDIGFFLIVVTSLFFSYKFIIFPYFGYEGYELSFNLIRCVVVLPLLLFVMVNRKHELGMFCGLFIIIPSFILFIFNDSISLNYILNVVLIFFIIVNKIFNLLIDKFFRSLNLDVNAISIFLLGLPYLIFLIFNFKSFEFERILDYELRSTFYNSYNPNYFRYINFGVNFLPLFIYGLLLKARLKSLSLLMFLLLSIMPAFVLSKKEPLFLVLVVIIYHYSLSKKSLVPLSRIMLIWVFSLILISFFVFFIFEDFVVPSTLLRRTFFLPNLISNEWVKFSDISGFSIFKDPSYLENHKFIIADQLGKFGAGANSGIAGTGYDYFGFLGSFVVALFSLVFYHMIRKVFLSFGFVDGSDRFFAAIIVGQGIMSSSLWTLIFTHGMFFVIVLILFSFKRV